MDEVLPPQLARGPGEGERQLWYAEPKSNRDPPLKNYADVENEMKNSRGSFVMDDKRSQGNGWKVGKLNERAIAAIKDLGPAGQA